MKRDRLEEKLAKLERRARGSKADRFFFRPVRYTWATFYLHTVYPFFPKGVKRKARTFFGKNMSVVLPAGMDLYLLGGKTHDSEIRLTRFLIRELRPGDTVIDVGAHFGFFTLLAAHLTGPEGIVYAFEASRKNFHLLAENTTGEPSIEIFHQAVSNRKGMLGFYEFPALFSEYNTLDIGQFKDHPWFRKHPPEKISVPAVSLDGFLSPEQISPRLVKIDVEGAEYQVLEGMQKTLERCPGLFIVLEFLAGSRVNAAHHQAKRLLEQHGYAPFRIDAGGVLYACPDPEAYLQEKGLDSDNIVFRRV